MPNIPPYGPGTYGVVQHVVADLCVGQCALHLCVCGGVRRNNPAMMEEKPQKGAQRPTTIEEGVNRSTWE
eukprot:5962577-Amphidinium_carterae.1